MNRRRFLERSAVSAAASLLPLDALAQAPKHTPAAPTVLNGIAVPDAGWSLWLDTEAPWQDDEIFLPADVNLETLPTNAPTGGWSALTATTGHRKTVTLPATVEEHFWGATGQRPYTPEEYRYAADDQTPQNGTYRGVSWWSRALTIPASMQGQRILLHIRGARMRAEVYLNRKLVGYSIMEELPFTCDLTAAAQPGAHNEIAIRITNPGGRYDWVDGSTITWGKVNLFRSHGFAGLDRALTLEPVPHTLSIDDVWVLNTPDPRAITVNASLTSSPGTTPHGGSATFEILAPHSPRALAKTTITSDGPGRISARLTYPDAKLWNLDSPTLYHLRCTVTANGHTHTRTVPFGFRWFAPTGLGTNAVFRLNGKRIKLYTSISWGYWGLNGLFPTPALAEREVTQAKRLGLNCLNFHRNTGKHDVLDAQDRLGLLRDMEPGGGKLSIGKLPSGVEVNAPTISMENPTNPADIFSQKFMIEKCRAMVRAFRSHPSLIQFTLQNELGADLKNPSTFTALKAMHDEDPSRCIVLNDGFVGPPRNAAQAWFEPYNDTLHRSDLEPAGGFWNNHQGAGDQWYDEFYKDADNFTYRNPLKTALVEFGEMEGCAVADNHSLLVDQILSKTFGGSGTSYDLTDHREILAAHQRFFDRWGFRKAFPTADAFFRSLGNKCYESWHQYMENARICDEVDVAAISGWESTSIENHSGIVDNMRNHKGDPDLIASSLRPIRLVAKQHKLCYTTGQSAVFDLYLLNDTGRTVTGSFTLSMITPSGVATKLTSVPAPANITDQFSYLLQAAFTTPALTQQGTYRFRFTSTTTPAANFERELWVADAKPGFTRKLRIATSVLLPATRRQLAALPDATVSNFQPGEHYDLLVTSGVVPGSALDRKIGDETGLEAQPVKGQKPAPQPLGSIPTDVLTAAKSGTPLLIMAPDDFLADGVAKQLAALGAFTYSGQVGDTRAPWMGNWLFVRQHPTFAHLPTDRVLSVHYQTHGKQSNGLLIDRAPGAPDPEVIMGYSRDHDRQLGAASFRTQLGTTPILFHRAPDLHPALQMRWLANTVAYLTGVQTT